MLLPRIVAAVVLAQLLCSEAQAAIRSRSGDALPFQDSVSLLERSLTPAVDVDVLPGSGDGEAGTFAAGLFWFGISTAGIGVLAIGGGLLAMALMGGGQVSGLLGAFIAVGGGVLVVVGLVMVAVAVTIAAGKAVMSAVMPRPVAPTAVFAELGRSPFAPLLQAVPLARF